MDYIDILFYRHLTVDAATRRVSNAVMKRMLATVLFLTLAAPAWAQDNDPCAGFTGEAKALCTAMIQVCAGPQTTPLHPRSPATR